MKGENMRKIHRLIIVTVLILVLMITGCSQNQNENEVKNDKQSIAPNEEKKICREFYTPFLSDKERTKYNSISERLIDVYGAYRRRGHKHAGIDLKGVYEEKVYCIGVGKVKGMLYSFPNNAVLIEHYLTDGTTIFSSYIHVVDETVSVGDWVDEKTQIGRLFNKDEQKKAGFDDTHLHIEIRKTIEDEGKASYSCKTIEELNKYFIDPQEFFKEQLE